MVLSECTFFLAGSLGSMSDWSARLMRHGARIQICTAYQDQPEDQVIDMFWRFHQDGVDFQRQFYGEFEDNQEQITIREEYNPVELTGISVAIYSMDQSQFEITGDLAHLESKMPDHVPILVSSQRAIPTSGWSSLTHPSRMGKVFLPTFASIMSAAELALPNDTEAEKRDQITALFERINIKMMKVPWDTRIGTAARLRESMWEEAVNMVRSGTAEFDHIDELLRCGTAFIWSKLGMTRDILISGDRNSMREYMHHLAPDSDQDEAQLRALADELWLQSDELRRQSYRSLMRRKQVR